MYAPLQLLPFAWAAICVCGPAYAGGTLETLALPPDALRSRASAVSADGSVVVGDFAAQSIPFLHRAIRWAPEGSTDLGGAPLRNATGVSADGSVVVGTSEQPIAYIAGAYRWTRAAGIVSQGMLNGGNVSYANGVSGDGTVIVGRAADGALNGAMRAYRWTAASGMTSLGVLPGGSFSEAMTVNADGSLVAGYSSISGASATRHAFLWTLSGGMKDLGVLPGVPSSMATGISAAGGVVVGAGVMHDSGGNPDGSVAGARAFRWDAATGMTSLGTLNGGPTSYALGVSADGRVVVGYAADGAAGNQQRGFRWTQAGGMQRIEDWLRANGAQLPPGLATSEARAASGDGSVVVGTLAGEQAYVARVTPGFGPGLITLADFQQSVYAVSALVSGRVATAQSILHGAHGHPMSRLVPTGSTTMWIAGDAGLDDHGPRDGKFGLAEFGFARSLRPNAQAGASLGATYAHESTPVNGSARQESAYLLLEASVAPDAGGRAWITGSLLADAAHGNVRRGYLSAGRTDSSTGSADTLTYGAAIRGDLLELARFDSLTLTPYAKVTWLRSRRDGYTETGGAFPARFDSQTAITSDGRLGIDAVYRVSGSTRLVGGLAAAKLIHRSQADLSGELTGLFGFRVPAQQADRRAWVQGTLGVESKLAGGIVSAYLNATTMGATPGLWLAASWRVVF